MSIVEAIQCKLGDTYILWPGKPENPPKRIYDNDIHYEQPRVFKKPNLKAPVFEYEYHRPGYYWELLSDKA